MGLSDFETYLDTQTSVSARKLDIFEAKFMINTLGKLIVLLQFFRGIQTW